MNSKRRRISSVLLALVLAISMLPITVFAAGPGDTPEWSESSN